MKPFSVTVKIKSGPGAERRELFRTEAETHEEAKGKALIHYGEKGIAFEIGLARDLSESIARDHADRDQETARRLRAFKNRTTEPDYPTQAELEAACKAGRAEYEFGQFFAMQDTPQMVMTTIGLMPAPKGNPKTVVAKIGGATAPLYLTPEELKIIDRALGFYSSDVCTSAEEENAVDSLRRSLKGGNAI